MKGRSQTALWAVALGGSLALHAAVGMALIAMPKPDPPQDIVTEITIETLPAAITETLAPAMAAVPVPAAAEAIAAVSDKQAMLTPLAETSPTQAATVAAVGAASASPDAQALPASDDSAATLDAIELTTKPVQPVVQAQPEPTLPAAEAIAPVEREAPDVPAAVGQNEVAAVVGATALPEAAAPTLDAVAAVLPDTNVALAAAEPDTPEATVDNTAPATQAAMAVPPARVGVAGQLKQVAPTATVATAAPLVPGQAIIEAAAPSMQAPVVSETTAANAASPLAPNETAQVAAPATSTDKQIAMVVPEQPTLPDDETPQQPGLALADFLKDHEGGDCLLAIPTAAAAMETLSDSAGDGAVLASLYAQMSGIAVRSEPRTVSKAQCGALSFSRSLPQYPAFALQFDLAARSVGSGGLLSGRVFGLRKNSLTLFVVDDEGIATLVSTFKGVTTTSQEFRAPVTLTSGPVASVQLLVAIASDGPLRSVATRPGSDATALFERLANEIRTDGRPIQYGITTFSVE